MKNLKYLIGTALVSLASIGLFVACGNGDGDDCTLDSECLTGEVCEGQVCTPTCETNDDCAMGQECLPRTNGTGMVCQASAGNANANANTSTMCMDNEDCGADEVCNTDTGMCESTAAPQVYAIAIEDVTTAAGACDGDDPGVDIQAVELLDANDASLGWADLLFDGADGGHVEQDPSLFDGSAPNLTDQCVDTFSGNVHALGCFGTLGLQFLDDGGAPVPLAEGQQIVVYEYGAQCGGDPDDEYNLQICPDLTAVQGGDISSCETVGNTSSGIGTFNVVLPMQ